MKTTLFKLSALIALFLLPVLASGQTVADSTVDPNFFEKLFGNLALFGGAIVLFAALFSIVQVFNSMAQAEKSRLRREQGLPEIAEVKRLPKPDFWSRFLKSATKTVPLAQEEDILLAHDYDGIRELDNRLPPWWLWLFYASIIFSGVYWFVFHMSDIGASQMEEYQADMEKGKAEVAAYQAGKGEQIDEKNVLVLTDATELALGQSIFTANCIACHGPAGEGNSIGPNLTDNYWLNGCGIQNVFKTIKHGRIEKGMQAWSGTMRPADMQRVASYILTLHSTNPPNAKAVQGEPCEGQAMVADSTKAM